jgi:hypothetical protein
MRLTAQVVAGAVFAIAIGSISAPRAGAQTYTSDPNLTHFTSTVAQYATFTNCAVLLGDLGCIPASFTTINNGNRIYGVNLAPAIFAAFVAPTKSIRVFANIDHPGVPFDGYQYTIAGSIDGVSYVSLFDALTVNGSGEPFTLGSFTGTAPTTVNNVIFAGHGGEGQTGYVADFTFSTAYQYYRFGASTVAVNQGNADQELSAVATVVPEPASLVLTGTGLIGLLGLMRLRKA